MHRILRIPGRRGLALSLTLLLLGGCKSWHPVPGDPAQVLTDQRPATVRVTDASGRLVTVRHPVVRNDSIVTSDTDVMGQPLRAEGVAGTEVGQVSVQRFSPVRTVLFAAAIVVAGVSWVKVNGDGDRGTTPPTPGPPKGFALSLSSALGMVTGLWR